MMFCPRCRKFKECADIGKRMTLKFQVPFWEVEQMCTTCGYTGWVPCSPPKEQEEATMELECKRCGVNTKHEVEACALNEGTCLIQAKCKDCDDVFVYETPLQNCKDCIYKKDV